MEEDREQHQNLKEESCAALSKHLQKQPCREGVRGINTLEAKTRHFENISILAS